MDGKKVSTWDVTGIAAGEYEVYFNCHVSRGNSRANGTVGLSTGDQLNDNKTTGNPVPGRYYMQAGTTDPVYTDTGSKNFYQVGIGDSDMTWTSEAVIPSIMIGSDTTELKLAHTGAGYSLYVQNVRLVRVGNYLPPATNIVFDENHAAKIEAEDYTIKHTIFTNTGEETDYTTNGTTYPADLSGSLEEDANASGGKYMHAIFREGWNNSKRSNMSGELVYRVKLAAAATVKIKAKIKSDMETEKVCLDLKVDGAGKGTLSSANAWVEVESDTMELAAGVHTISFVGQQLSGSENYRSVLADIDWFQVIDATPAA